MPNSSASRAVIRRFFLGLAVVLFSAACAPSAGTPPAASPTPSEMPRSAPAEQADAFSDVPAAARAATRVGDPRPPAYWAVWNSCAPDNRAAQAAANGGRAAGFTLLDDLIADPGIQLGDYPVTTCEQGLALLQGLTAAGEPGRDPLYGLASALLAAELNLNVGAETCPIVEEAVVGAHLILSTVGFTGSGEYAASAEVASAIPRLVELLTGYNLGQLCR